MRKIKNIEDALLIYESNALVKDECDELGNYRRGNRAHDNMRKIVKYLLENGSIDKLKIFYTSENASLRLSAAAYLAPIDGEVCYNIVKEIMNTGKGWPAFNAEMIIEYWGQVSSKDDYVKILSEE